MTKKKFSVFKNVFLPVILAVCISFTVVNDVYAKSDDASFSSKSAEISVKKQKTNDDILSLIDKYQDKYFSVIKRNDVLLKYEDDNELNKDRKELKKLYAQVKKQVKNKEYLKKYKNIEKKYAKCSETSTIGINEFMDSYYYDVEELLDEVYSAVKTKISSEDFNKLELSENNWIKEVNDYNRVYESMQFGTIGSMIFYDYQINMNNFRALLLMIYL